MDDTLPAKNEDAFENENKNYVSMGCCKVSAMLSGCARVTINCISYVPIFAYFKMLLLMGSTIIAFQFTCKVCLGMDTALDHFLSAENILPWWLAKIFYSRFSAQSFPLSMPAEIISSYPPVLEHTMEHRISANTHWSIAVWLANTFQKPLMQLGLPGIVIASVCAAMKPNGSTML